MLGGPGEAPGGTREARGAGGNGGRMRVDSNGKGLEPADTVAERHARGQGPPGCGGRGSYLYSTSYVISHFGSARCKASICDAVTAFFDRRRWASEPIRASGVRSRTGVSEIYN